MKGSYIYTLIALTLTLLLSACGKNPAARDANPLSSYPDLTEYVNPELQNLIRQSACIDTYMTTQQTDSGRSQTETVTFYGPTLTYNPTQSKNYVICLPEPYASDSLKPVYIVVTSEALKGRIALQALPTNENTERSRWLLSLGAMDSIESEFLTLVFTQSTDVATEAVSSTDASEVHLVFQLTELKDDLEKTSGGK